MNEQDRRAVENMCLTGMYMDALYACFPSFPKEEIEKVYRAVKEKPENGILCEPYSFVRLAFFWESCDIMNLF